MNHEEYIKKYTDIINSRQANIDFLKTWYKNEKKFLEQLSKQKEEIKHPSHRGILREVDFKKILDSIIPESFKTTKGYAVSDVGILSNELDCIIYSKDKTFTLIKEKDLEYIPQHSVLSAIEIKSNYNLSEIRKSIINCLSLKTFVKNEKDRFLYSVFAYNSPYKLNELCAKLNKFSKEFETHISTKESPKIKQLPIDVVYVLGKGIIYRKNQKGYGMAISLDEILKSTGEYGYIPDKGEEDFSFLFFIGIIIDFIIKENQNRDASSFLPYVYLPEIIKAEIKKKIEEKKKSQYENKEKDSI